VIPKELLSQNLAYLSMVCNVSIKHLKKLDQFETKEEVTGLKMTIADGQYLKGMSLRNWIKISS